MCALSKACRYCSWYCERDAGRLGPSAIAQEVNRVGKSEKLCQACQGRRPGPRTFTLWRLFLINLSLSLSLSLSLVLAQRACVCGRAFADGFVWLMYKCTHVCTYECICASVNRHTQIRNCVYMHVCMHTCVCVCMCVCVCICIHFTHILQTYSRTYACKSHTLVCHIIGRRAPGNIEKTLQVPRAFPFHY